MSDDVTLVAGTIVEHLDVDGVWKRAPRITSTGDTGSLAEAKEKTTVEDRTKRYSDGLLDGGDKNFKGQRIPAQTAGSEHALDRTLQEVFINRCKALDEMQMRITWPDMERANFTWKSLGYMVDDATAEDWKMFTTNGKQNTIPVFDTAPTLTGITLGGTGTLTVGQGEQLTTANTPLGAFWEVNQDSFSSDDEAVATVTPWGYVVGVSAGTVNISVIRKVGDGTTVTDTLAVTVS